MTDAITEARRATRRINRTTCSLGRTLCRRAVRGMSDLARSYASWSDQAWTGRYGPWSAL